MQTIPRKGTYVSRIDRDDIADHYQIFGQVAGLAAARAVSRLDDDDLARLVDCTTRCPTPTASTSSSINHEFHRTINRAAGSQRMTSMLLLLSQSLPMPYADSPAEWLDEANRQHRDIIDAFRRRDTRAAQRAMEQHINASARHAIEVLGASTSSRMSDGPVPALDQRRPHRTRETGEFLPTLDPMTTQARGRRWPGAGRRMSRPR